MIILKLIIGEPYYISPKQISEIRKFLTLKIC